MFKIKCFAYSIAIYQRFSAIIHLESRCAPYVIACYKQATGSGELLQNLSGIKTAFAHLFQKKSK